MHGPNSLSYELRELKNKEDFFSLVTQPYRERLPYWSDIFSAYKSFYQYNENHYDSNKITKYFYSVENFKFLEELGWNYNFIDEGGNNFLQYIYSLNRTKRDDDPSFGSESIKYVISKTENIYHSNKANKHLLFDMLGIIEAGMQGEIFFDFIKKYPKFDYHQISRDGKNLMFHLLLNNSPKEVIEFFIEKKVDITLIDNDGHTLLHMFGRLAGLTENNRQLFSLAMKSIDITKKNRWKENPLNSWLDFHTSDSVHSQSKPLYRKLITAALTHINRQDFFYNDKTLIDIEKILKKNKNKYLNSLKNYVDKDKYFKFEQQYLQAISTVRYMSLDNKLSIKQEEPTKRLKI